MINKNKESKGLCFFFLAKQNTGFPRNSVAAEIEKHKDIIKLQHDSGVVHIKKKEVKKKKAEKDLLFPS